MDSGMPSGHAAPTGVPRHLQPGNGAPPLSARQLRMATIIMAILAVVFIGAAVIDLPKSTRAYFGPPTCGFVAMQPADLCRYEEPSRANRSRGRNKYFETLLPGGFVPRDEAATTRSVSVANYDGMRDIRRGEVRLNLIGEVIALLIGLLIARSLIRRGVARLRAARTGAPSADA